MKNKRYSKGFTLIELLVVIAIIGILASIIMLSISGSRERAQLAAFKQETSQAASGFLYTCQTANPAVPADSDVTNWAAAFTATSCGSTGSGTFSITATPVNANITCTATVRDSGATYAGAECNL